MLPVTPSPVAYMHESRINYQLVIRQSQIIYKSCQTLNDAEIALAITPERTYIRRLAKNVLRRRNASDKPVNFGTPVAAIYGKRLAPSIPQRLKDIINKCLDVVPHLGRGYDIADIILIRHLTLLKFTIGEVLTYCSHSTSIQVHILLRREVHGSHT